MIDCFINEIVLSMDSFYGALKWKHNHVCKHAKSNKSMCVVSMCGAVQRHNKEPNQSVDAKKIESLFFQASATLINCSWFS